MKGIIIASFGTTHIDAFEKSIEKIKIELQEKYPDIYMIHSFSSEMVRNSLNKRKIHFFNLPEALNEMEEKGIRDITILSLYVICGIEFEKIVNQSKVFNDKSRLNIRFSKPLLSSKEDIENISSILVDTFNEKPTVLMGHGTTNPVDKVYFNLQDSLLRKNTNIFVGTVEGTLDFKDVLKNLEHCNKKDVKLAPFLLVAGDHAKNDMGSEEEDSWANLLRNEGFNVEVELKGLCEREEIREIFYKKLEEVLWN